MRQPQPKVGRPGAFTAQRLLPFSFSLSRHCQRCSWRERKRERDLAAIAWHPPNLKRRCACCYRSRRLFFFFDSLVFKVFRDDQRIIKEKERDCGASLLRDRRAAISAFGYSLFPFFLFSGPLIVGPEIIKRKKKWRPMLGTRHFLKETLTPRRRYARIQAEGISFFLISHQLSQT